DQRQNQRRERQHGSGNQEAIERRPALSLTSQQESKHQRKRGAREDERQIGSHRERQTSRGLLQSSRIFAPAKHGEHRPEEERHGQTVSSRRGHVIQHSRTHTQQRERKEAVPAVAKYVAANPQYRYHVQQAAEQARNPHRQFR